MSAKKTEKSKGQAGQLNLFDFLEKESKHEKEERRTINFSCFSTFQSEANGVMYGECVVNHCCDECEAYCKFYEKADEYYAAGNGWGKSVALTKRFFGIPSVPEYEVEMYQ